MSEVHFILRPILHVREIEGNIGSDAPEAIVLFWRPAILGGGLAGSAGGTGRQRPHGSHISQ